MMILLFSIIAFGFGVFIGFNAGKKESEIPKIKEVNETVNKIADKLWDDEEG